MGDSYVKSEFRLTRSTDNPLHIIGFLSQWKHYLDDLQQSKGDWKGRKLDQDAFEKLSPEQVGQLYELMHATKEVWKSYVQDEFRDIHNVLTFVSNDKNGTAGE